MARTVEEWVGKTDDAVPPPRVRLRSLDAHNGRCWKCTRKILTGEYWQLDHKIALINGGENRERNLAPLCCNCCPDKNAADVGEKSTVAEKRKKHALPRKPAHRWGSRPMNARYEPRVRDVNEDLK